MARTERRGRRWTVRAGAALGACWLSAAAAQSPPRANTIVARMGEPMSESQARHAIAFQPFAPPRRIIGAALLPPFHGDDSRTSRGIGLEYVDDAGRRYALAEWPANGGTLDAFAAAGVAASQCATVRSFPRGTKPDGIVWSTPHGIIISLQADGANDARTLEIEWNKLIRRGACR